MYKIQFITNFLLFLIPCISLIHNRKNIIITLMNFELILLSVNMNFLIFSSYISDIYGQIVSLFILTLAASEAALGLAILISFFRIRGNIIISDSYLLKS